jgi:hypothetical protein
MNNCLSIAWTYVNVCFNAPIKNWCPMFHLLCTRTALKSHITSYDSVATKTNDETEFRN